MSGLAASVVMGDPGEQVDQAGRLAVDSLAGCTNRTSTGAYRSCAALFDISNPLRYLVKSGLVWLVLVWFGLVDFCFVCMVLV